MLRTKALQERPLLLTLRDQAQEDQGSQRSKRKIREGSQRGKWNKTAEGSGEGRQRGGEEGERRSGRKHRHRNTGTEIAAVIDFQPGRSCSSYF